MTEDGVDGKPVDARLDKASELRDLTEAVRHLDRADTARLCQALMKAYEGYDADANRLSRRVRNWVTHQPGSGWNAWVKDVQRSRQRDDSWFSDLRALRADQNEIQSDFLIAIFVLLAREEPDTFVETCIRVPPDRFDRRVRYVLFHLCEDLAAAQEVSPEGQQHPERLKDADPERRGD